MTQTTDEKVFSMKYSKFIPAVIGMLLATNTVTGLVFNQERNTETIYYNDEKTGRKITQGDYIVGLQTDIKFLTRDILDLEEDKDNLKEELKLYKFNK